MKPSHLLLHLSIGAFAVAQEDFNQSSEPILLLSNDSSFHFELLVPLGQSIFSGGDIGPILGAAKNITPGDFESFSSVFYTLATQHKAVAEDPALAYDPVNVRDTWFAASTYFRRADFYLHGNWDDPRINTYWKEQAAAFDKAIAALPVPGQRLKIPAEGFDVEALWFPVSLDCETKHPTLIVGNGYDESHEDLYHEVVAPAQARGWNVLAYEGPGQPTVRRNQNLGFIPDWERVVTPVVDYLLTEQATIVDPKRLALFGYSFGGYLAARAAAFEPRLSALLVDGGIWSTYESFTKGLTNETRTLLESGQKDAFDASILGFINGSFPDAQPTSSDRWGIEQGLWAFNTKSPFDYMTQARNYTLEGLVDKIQMPVWVADTEFDAFFPGQAIKVKQALGDRATYHKFTGSAGYHCEVGSMQELNREMFAWLHKTLA